MHHDLNICIYITCNVMLSPWPDANGFQSSFDYGTRCEFRSYHGNKNIVNGRTTCAIQVGIYIPMLPEDNFINFYIFT